MTDEDVEFTVELTIGGRTVKMTELTVYDRAAILKKYKAILKDIRRANVKEAGLDKEQVYTELEEFDKEAKKMGDDEFVEFILTDEGKVEVFEAALRPNVGDEASAIAKLAKFKNDEFRILCGLCNLRPKAPVEEQPNPNPPAGVDPTTATTKIP